VGAVPTSRNLVISTAEAKALGLIQSSGTVFDGSVGFSSSFPFSYAPDVPVSGQYYFIGTVEHEISEVLGRVSQLNSSGHYAPIDLFRYAAAGQRQLTTGAPSYFSIDGGSTPFDAWNNPVAGNGGDLADWAPSAGFDAYLDNSPSDQVNEITPTDLTLMSALGWISTSETTGSGQTFVVSAGQTGNELAVQSGGIVAVLSGGTALDTVISNGGLVTVDGLAVATLIAGGLETVDSGGVAHGATISSGGEQDIDGTASGGEIFGGAVDVMSGGAYSSSTDFAGAVTNIFAGGIADHLVLSSGGQINVLGTVTSNVTVSGGGLMVISSGGVVSGALGFGTGVHGGTVDVQSGGKFSFFTDFAGGETDIAAGGIASHLSVSSGGVVDLMGTITNNVAVFAGGLEVISSGGVQTGQSGSGTGISGGTIDVLSGGELDHATVSSGGTLDVSAGGTIHNIAVSNGGILLLQGALTNNYTVFSGGTLTAGSRASQVAASSAMVVLRPSMAQPRGPQC
jgi:autotransporter passenger strand-loop-strand repeat protein